MIMIILIINMITTTVILITSNSSHTWGEGACRSYTSAYGQTANEDPRTSEFESKRILNLEGGLS